MRKQLTAFYLESLLLVGLFTAVLLVLLGVFGAAKQQSSQAGRLTQAVLRAENAAEALAASDSAESLQALLDERDNTQWDGDVLTVFYDDSTLRLSLHRDGPLLTGSILVSRGGEEIYTLETAVYARW